MKQDRLISIDIARGIAILAIIIGHMGLYNLNRIVYTFHVPIFFLITGYFVSDNVTIKEIINKRLKTLIIPYIVCCIWIIVLNGVKTFIISNGQLQMILKGSAEFLAAAMYGAGTDWKLPFHIKSIGAIWFLLAAFWGEILLRLSLKLKEYYRIIFLTMILLAAILSCKKILLPLSIQPGMAAAFFMYLGYLGKKIVPQAKCMAKEVQIVGIFCALIIWLEFIVKFDAFYLVRCELGQTVINIFRSVCACVVIFWFSKKIENKKIISSRLAYIGKYSVIVLQLHIIEMNFIPWEGLIKLVTGDSMSQLTMKIIALACKIFFCMIGTYILSQNVFLKRMFGINGK